MQISPDFSEAVDFGKIPNGIYKARIIGCEMKTSQAGNSYLNWKLQVFGAEGAFASYNNRTLTHMTMTTGKGSGNLKQLLKATLETEGAFDTDALLGKEIEITLGDKRNQDGTVSDYPEVKAVNKLH